MWPEARRRGLAVAIALLGAVAPAVAQSPASPDPAAIESRRDAARAEASAIVDSTSPRLAALQKLGLALTQQLDALQLRSELGRRREALEAERAAGPAAAVPGEPPYPVDALDPVEEILRRTQRLESEAAAARDEAEAALEAAETAAQEAERRRRAEREAPAGASAAGEVEAEAAEALVELRRLQLANARDAAQLERDRRAQLERVLEWVREHVAVRRGDLARRLAPLDAQEAALERRRSRAQLDAEAAHRRWKAAQARVDPKASPGPGDEAELAARRAEVTAAEKDAALLAEQVERLRAGREAETRRLEALGRHRPPRAELLGWLTDAEKRQAELRRDQQLDESERAAVERDLRALPATESPEAAAWRQRESAALRAMVAAYDANLESLSAAIARQDRLAGTLRAATGHASLRDRLGEMAAAVGAVWSYEVTSSDDQAITIGKIVLALAVFFLGLAAARSVARLLGARLLPRVGLDPGAAQALESLGFYALLVVAFLVALRTVNIPLTAFAFVGGALAIGVGFGSQNIVNNFISGLILLAERPIKIGDLVQVEGTYGNIERIGLRSTRVRTGENIHVIVPNSVFLENNVVNWTHNDPQVRVRLVVGVVYGSPTREVERLLRLAIEEHPRAMEEPAPLILFTDFGNDSLVFDALFWIRMRNQLERQRIESELRFRIDDLFREAGIVIAFPQRDVHLDAPRPLEVRLLPAGGPPAREPGEG